VCTQRRIASIIKSYKSVGISKMSFINCIVLPKQFWRFGSQEEMEAAAEQTKQEFLEGKTPELFAETVTSFFAGKDYTQADYEINVETDCINAFKYLFCFLFDN